MCAPHGAMTPSPFRVQQREQNTADTWTLALEPLEGERPAIAPGQFMMVYAFGIGEVPISVSGVPDRAGPVMLTVRAVGAVTNAVCAAAPGALLWLRGPFGNGWPAERAVGGDVVVVAGGIGLAPLRPLILGILAERERYGSVSVLYGARTPADLLYLDQFDAWRASLAVEVTVDAADGGWNGRVGVVPKLVASTSLRPDRSAAFLCGPEIMMRFTVEALLARGMASAAISLSMERHMECGVGLCGHCQLGPTLICRDGPVYTYDRVRSWMEVREL